MKAFPSLAYNFSSILQYHHHYHLLCSKCTHITIIIIIKAICNAHDPLKKAANALSGS